MVWEKVYPISKIADENPLKILIVVMDSAKYKACLKELGSEYVEGINVVDGWHMPNSFFVNGRWDKEADQVVLSAHNAGWDQRAYEMVNMLPDDVGSILDFGCGNSLCKKYLDSSIKYYGLDIIKRNENTIICDVNCDSLPNLDYDCAYMAGFLGYIDDVDSFAKKMTAKYILCSCRGKESYQKFGDFETKSKICGLRNSLYTAEYIQVFLENGYTLKNIKGHRGGTVYCLFERED